MRSLQLIRHATLRVKIGGSTFLVDPMLSPAGTMPAIDNTANDLRNPLVEMPMAVEEVLDGVDAILVTHTHRDHWDAAATSLVHKHMPILCQPEDREKFHEWGFEDVRPIYAAAVFAHTTMYRTGGQHGTGEIGKAMAPVSGYSLRARTGEELYIAGDTIFCDEVGQALAEHKPKYTVVNAGGARFNEGDAITMAAEDVVEVCRAAPWTKVIAVHMEAINHCGVSRADLAEALEREGLRDQVLIPADGEVVSL